MKVAIATTKEGTLSQHFGRSDCWLILEIENSAITGSEIRANNHRHDMVGGCHSGAHDNGAHGHGDIISVLKDCAAVISAGMGWRVAEELKQNCIQPYMASRMYTPKRAVERFVAGELEPADKGFCRGRHTLPPAVTETRKES